MKFVLGLVVGLALVLAGLAFPQSRRWLAHAVGASPDATAVSLATLESVRREGKLVVFSAQLLVTTTATTTATLVGLEVPGTTAERTLIVPGRVHYAVDLARLSTSDLTFDPATATLTVRRPPVMPMPPVADLEARQVFDSRGLLVPFTHGAEDVEERTLAAVVPMLRKEGRSPELMRLADQAADDMVAWLFARPLEAAGLGSVKVEVVRPTEGPEGREG
ncbi:DUF4230 domain-containing protein [Thermaurantiacus sp.]